MFSAQKKNNEKKKLKTNENWENKNRLNRLNGTFLDNCIHQFWLKHLEFDKIYSSIQLQSRLFASTFFSNENVTHWIYRLKIEINEQIFDSFSMWNLWMYQHYTVYVHKCLVGYLTSKRFGHLTSFTFTLSVVHIQRIFVIGFIHRSLYDNCTSFFLKAHFRFRVQFTVTNTMAFFMQ